MVQRERYRIEGEIGKGGMGSVYLAEDLRLPGRRCAIKEIRFPADLDDFGRDALRERFLGEAAVLARLDHPSLPKVSDHFESEGRAWLVMDFVSGQDLDEVLRHTLALRRQLEVDTVMRWAGDVLACLDYLHAQEPPVIHRDIKPANIKLTPDGQVKLVDFGLAQSSELGDGRTVTMLSGAGSRPYQPLEQYGDGLKVDARSDLYALGATLYHLLTGRQPEPAQERFLEGEDSLGVRSVRADIPLRIQRALGAALALHPDDRPNSAEDLRLLLFGRAPLATRSGEANLGRATTGEVMRANAWLIATVITLFLAALALTLG